SSIASVEDDPLALPVVDRGRAGSRRRARRRALRPGGSVPEPGGGLEAAPGLSPEDQELLARLVVDYASLGRGWRPEGGASRAGDQENQGDRVAQAARVRRGPRADQTPAPRSAVCLLRIARPSRPFPANPWRFAASAGTLLPPPRGLPTLASVRRDWTRIRGL